ncbi:MAG TPA: DUF4190 domain-containing protein [Pyrinomonadaceae bacterium]|nr:DUF4190 domain-containing protein [Pyrinomonadaceae bacterium]
MKRCPTCNQVFTEDWLTFCTTDGTSLVVDSAPLPYEPPHEPPPTIKMNEAPTTSQEDRPTVRMQPDAMSAGLRQPTQPPMAQPWQPPPPIGGGGQNKNLGLLSMILGIVTMTIGWCCYFGVLTGPIAIILGFIALSQIKKEPNKYGGRGMALAGIITGALYFVFLILIILIYGLSFLMSGVR